jgi:uncharacterized cupredoxin-like copper-binding protein
VWVFRPFRARPLLAFDGQVPDDRRTRLLKMALALPLVLLPAACSSGSSVGVASSAAGPGAPAGMMPGFGWVMGQTPAGYHLSRVTCSAPAALPGTTVHVVVADMGMTRMMGGRAPLGQPMMLRAVPSQVPAGLVSFVVANMGWRSHEMVVLPLAAGRQAGERTPGPDATVDETGSLGEASASCAAGPGDGIQAGTTGWVTLRLPAGRYELICNIRNHYADGMYQEFTVA